MRRKASGHAISDNCRPSLKTAPGMDPAHQYVLPEQKWLADLIVSDKAFLQRFSLL